MSEGRVLRMIQGVLLKNYKDKIVLLHMERTSEGTGLAREPEVFSPGVTFKYSIRQLERVSQKLGRWMNLQLSREV